MTLSADRRRDAIDLGRGRRSAAQLFIIIQATSPPIPPATAPSIVNHNPSWLSGLIVSFAAGGPALAGGGSVGSTRGAVTPWLEGRRPWDEPCEEPAVTIWRSATSSSVKS